MNPLWLLLPLAFLLRRSGAGAAPGQIPPGELALRPPSSSSSLASSSAVLAGLGSRLVGSFAAAGSRASAARGFAGGSERPRFRFSMGVESNLTGVPPAMLSAELPFAWTRPNGPVLVPVEPERTAPWRVGDPYPGGSPNFFLHFDSDGVCWLGWGQDVGAAFGWVSNRLQAEYAATGKTAAVSAALWAADCPRLVLDRGVWRLAGFGGPELAEGVFNNVDLSIQGKARVPALEAATRAAASPFLPYEQPLT